MAIIHFPKLDKKSYIIIGFIVFCWISYTINDLAMNGILPHDNHLFDKICQFLIYIPYFIFLTFRTKDQKNDVYIKESLLFTEEKRNSADSQKFSKNNWVLFTLVIFLDILSDIAYTIYDKNDEELHESYGEFIRINIKLIFVLIFSRFYSRIIYHKHRVISLFIIAFFTTLIEIIKNWRKKDNYYLKYKNIILLILLSLSDGLIICYKHYLLEIKLFRVQSISFIFGFINFIFIVILMIIQHFYGDSIFFNKDPEFINFEYKTSQDWEKIIVSFIINSITFLIFYKILHKYTPNHLLLTFIICRYIPNLKNSYDEEDKLIYLIIYGVFFVVIFICILIFLEIMELNFCHLNENTRRNILKREKKEEKKLGGNSSSINDSDNPNTNSHSDSNNSNNRESKLQDSQYIYHFGNDSKESKTSEISKESKNTSNSFKIEF